MATSASLPQESSVGETQLLVSQILHDFISHFTAISTGLDMPLHMAKEIFPMLLQSRQQLNAYLNVMRFLFAQGDGDDQQGPEMVAQYANSMGVSITVQAQPEAKIMTGLTLWVIKHLFARNQTNITWGNRTLHVRSAALQMHTPEWEVLLGNAPCKSPRDSFSAYLARLLNQKNITLELTSPLSKEIVFRLHEKNDCPQREPTAHST
jgi:hypothetical protein